MLKFRVRIEYLIVHPRAKFRARRRIVDGDGDVLARNYRGRLLHFSREGFLDPRPYTLDLGVFRV